MIAILRVLQESPKPLGSQRIAEVLLYSGIHLNERSVRNYLAHADELGWTENLGRRGRQLTLRGAKELEGALVVDKVGFVSTRVDTLAYQMDFDLEHRKGRVILNISTLSPRDFRPAIKRLMECYENNLGMGRLIAIGKPGEHMGDFVVPQGCMAIGTICSVSMNGIFLHANIATTSRFGGLLQLENHLPRRFTQIITYDGSSLDPLEIFIRGQMTSVYQSAHTGEGVIGVSFREVPSVALPEVRRLSDLTDQAGLGGVLTIGSPNQPLLDVPVPQGRAGLLVCGGLNPIAAVVEAGISVTSAAMSTLYEYERLVDYHNLELIAAELGA